MGRRLTLARHGSSSLAAPADIDDLIKQLKDAAKSAGLPADTAEAWLKAKVQDGKVDAEATVSRKGSTSHSFYRTLVIRGPMSMVPPSSWLLAVGCWLCWLFAVFLFADHATRRRPSRSRRSFEEQQSSSLENPRT